MSAKDLQTTIEIPWLPGSKLTIRPMTLSDERMLLSNGSEGEAYAKLVKSCVTETENFDWKTDYSLIEHAYLLSKIRQITYGDEMVLSGYECPHCKHKNSNHLVNLSEYKIYPNLEPMYYTLEKSPLGDKKWRIAHPTLGRIEEMNNRYKEMKNDKKLSEDEIMGKFLQLQLISIFPGVSLECLEKWSDSGELSAYDIKKANHMLNNNPYGYDYRSTMKCHKCGQEMDISLHVLGSGFLVPYFGD